MSDPTSLAHQGDYLAHRLNRNVSHDLDSLLADALAGYPEDTVEETEDVIVREPAVDKFQGCQSEQRYVSDPLLEGLREAIGGF